MSDPEFVATAEAASILGCSVATVNRKATSGDLEVVARASGVSGARFFRRADVLALAATKRADLEAELAAIAAPAESGAA